MQEALAALITLIAVVYGVVRIAKTIAGRRECVCDHCPMADCPGREAGGRTDCAEK